MERCEMCKEIFEIYNIIRTSGNHCLCWVCANKAVEASLLTKDCDNLYYDYTNDALGTYLKLEETK